MRNFKKTMAIVLSLVMLFCMLPINTFATDKTYLTITLDEVINLSFDENNGYYIYAFTPTETGVYSFYSFNNGSDDDHLDTYGIIHDSNWQRIAYSDDDSELNNFNVSTILKANETYYLEATTYSYNSSWNFENGNCSIVIAKSDTNITPLTLDTPFTQSVDGEVLTFFSFTPSETAVYEINRTYNQQDLYSELNDPFDSNYNFIDYIYWNSESVSDNDNTSILQYKLQKNITYYFSVSFEGSGSYTVSIRKPDAATSIFLEETAINGFVGIEYSNTANFGPEGCAYENTTWSITDESIAEIINYGDDLGGRYISIKMLKVGSATVTAKGESDLTTSFTITATEPEEIFVDSAKNGTLSYEKAENAYKFIPQNDGVYNFQMSSNGNTSLHIYNSNFESIYSDNGTVTAQESLQKGETYYVHISPSIAEPDEMYEADYTLNITLATNATSLEITCDTDTIYPNQRIQLYPNFKPSGAIVEYIDWDIDNTDVADIEYCDSNCIEIYCKKPGTATVTATSENELTATYTITVKGYDALTLDTPYTKTTESYETNYVQFIPPEKAVYEICFEHPNHIPFSYNFMDSDYNQLNYIRSYSNDENDLIEIEKAQYQLEKDKTYYIETCTESEMTYTITMTKPTPATSLSINQEAISDFVGSRYGLSINFNPEGCAYEKVTWSITDESIAKLTPSNLSNFANITLLKAGTATVTATSESGFSDTCTVTVTDPEEIFVDTTKNGTLTATKCSDTYKFIPKSDGAYKFQINDSEHADKYLFIKLRDKNNDSILTSDGTFSEEQVILQQGETYYLEIHTSTADYPEGFEANYFINITIPPKAASMSLWCDTDVIYVNTDVNIFPSFYPEDSAIEYVEWNIDNSDIAYISSSSFNYAWIYCHAPGTTTITATTENGLSASYTLNIKAYSDAPTLNLNGKTTVPTKPTKSVFQFTPTESGTYAFYSTGNIYTLCNLLDSDMSYITSDSGSGEGDNFYIEYYLNAGETYYITSELSNNYDDAQTYDIYLKYLVPATSVRILNGSSYKGYVDDIVPFYAKLNPTNAISEELIWTIEDENIAYISDYYANGEIDLYLQSIGTTTVTVTTKSGLSDSIKITVKDNSKPEYIKISQTSLTGHVGDGDNLSIEFFPNIIEDVFWSSSNLDIASVDEYGNIYFEKEGTATITATTGSGLTASCIVTVLPSEKIELNTTKRISVTTPNRSVRLSFTPKENGYYTFYSISPYDTYGLVGDYSNDDCGSNKNFRISEYLYAGDTYTVFAGFYGNSIGEFDVRMERLDVDASDGDIDFSGEVDALDLAWMRKLLLDIIPLDSASRDVYDINLDGSFDVRDLVRLKTILASIPPKSDPLTASTWQAYSNSGKYMNDIKLDFAENVVGIGVGDPLSEMSDDIISQLEPTDIITINGAEYYFSRATGWDITYTKNGNIISVSANESDGIAYKFTLEMTDDDTLTVLTAEPLHGNSAYQGITAGTVFTKQN